MFKGTLIHVNKDMVPALYKVMATLYEQGLMDEVSKVCGAYSPRRVRGDDTTWSTHAYALAIDLNCDKIKFPSESKGFSCEFVRVWENAGFVWGGSWNRPDAMHFDWLKRASDRRATTVSGVCEWII